MDKMFRLNLPLTKEQYISLATAPDDPSIWSGEDELPMPFREHEG